MAAVQHGLTKGLSACKMSMQVMVSGLALPLPLVHAGSRAARVDGGTGQVAIVFTG